MLITTVISLSKCIVSFRELNRKSVVLMTRNIEEWRIVKRLEFMLRVVREEGNFLVVVSL
jgi:hypothetical protein